MPTTKPKIDLSNLFTDSEIDKLPPVMTAEQVAPLLGTTANALAQDRFRGVGVPYVKHGSRIRYLRADVAQYLIDRRVTPA